MDTEQFCFTNQVNRFNKTIINVCFDAGESQEVNQDISLKLNIIGNFKFESRIDGITKYFQQCIFHFHFCWQH